MDEDSGRAREGQWEEALRSAQQELDSLRDKHARERQRLEQNFHASLQPTPPATPQHTALLDDAAVLGESQVQQKYAEVNDVKASDGEQATDALRLHKQLLRTNDKLRQQDEQVKHSRQPRPHYSSRQAAY